MLSAKWSSQTFPLRKAVFRPPVVLWTRQSSRTKIRMKPRMAQSTAKLDRRVRMPTTTEKDIDGMMKSAQRAIPVQMLKDAEKAGVLKSSSQAIHILSNCISLAHHGYGLSKNDLEMLIKGLGSVHTVAIVAYLATCHPPTAKVGKYMLMVSADLGSIFAVVALASDYLKLTTPGRSLALVHLEAYAKQQNDPQTMVAHGIVLRKRGQQEEAMKFFEKAMEMTEPAPSNPFIDFTLSGRIVQPWAAYGSLKGDMGDKEAARKALEIGALVYENVGAIKLFAQNLGSSEDRGKYVEYMTKLAMLGDEKACFQLGSFYLKQFYEETKNGASKGIFHRLASLLRLEDLGPRSLAIEWFRIAAEYGHSRSALLAAGLLREDQKFKEGVLYLDTAEQDQSCSESARSMRDCFLNLDVSIDLESELPTETYVADV